MATYGDFRKEFTLQSLAGFIAVVVIMTTMVLFGVYVSGTLILVCTACFYVQSALIPFRSFLSYFFRLFVALEYFSHSEDRARYIYIIDYNWRSTNLLRWFFQLVISIGILIALSAGILASFSFSIYHEVNGGFHSFSTCPYHHALLVYLFR